MKKNNRYGMKSYKEKLQTRREEKLGKNYKRLDPNQNLKNPIKFD